MSDKIPEQAVDAANEAAANLKKTVEAAKLKSVGISGKALGPAKQADRILLRLNKLLATPGGLSAFLSTSNYTLYILSYLETRFRRSPAPPLPTGITALALLLSKCRTTLRLLGTLPLYAWLRSLVGGPKPGADPVLHRIALVQATAYFTYQVLENICVLADAAVVPPAVVARLNRGDPATPRLYTTAYRFWLAGVSCDFLRLGREAVNLRKIRAPRSSEEKVASKAADEKIDKRWWMDMAIASAWLPMAVHFSGVIDGGVPGWNLGVMGVCGIVAGGERMRGLWRGTAL